MSKVTVIGFTGSGKTTYLVGMYQAMGNVIENFSLMGKDNATDLWLDTLWENMIETGTPPHPTNKLEVFNFHLAHCFNPVCDFYWRDYPGDFLAVDANSPERQQLMDDIKESDCLFFIVEGKLLTVDSPVDDADYEQKLMNKLNFNPGLQREFRCLMQLPAAGIALPPIAIVVTKADLIDARYQAVVNSVLHKRFAAIFDAPGRLVLQVAVSLGGSIEPGFVPNPFCVEQPIAFAVLTIFINHIKAARVKIQENADFIREHINDFFPPREAMARARANINALQGRISIESDHSLNLLNLFPTNKLIYVGGAANNLRNHYRDIFTALSDTSNLTQGIN